MGHCVSEYTSNVIAFFFSMLTKLINGNARELYFNFPLWLFVLIAKHYSDRVRSTGCYWNDCGLIFLEIPDT